MPDYFYHYSTETCKIFTFSTIETDTNAVDQVKMINGGLFIASQEGLKYCFCFSKKVYQQ